MAELLAGRGLPRVAVDDVYSAPVHLNVGGKTYITTLATLTKFPESKLAKLFNGTLPITLDPLNRHYFLDVDGSVFTHILNFLRHGKLVLPEDFNQFPLLKEQAEFFELEAMMSALINQSKYENEEENETEEEHMKQHQRRRRKKKGNKQVIAGGEARASGQEERETGGGSGVVVMERKDSYEMGQGIITLHSTEELNLEEPISGFINLKSNNNEGGHWWQYSFDGYDKRPKGWNFTHCEVLFYKQLLDRGYELSSVTREDDHQTYKYMFTRVKQCNSSLTGLTVGL